jgi:hypothetical protein
MCSGFLKTKLQETTIYGLLNVFAIGITGVQITTRQMQVEIWFGE